MLQFIIDYMPYIIGIIFVIFIILAIILLISKETKSNSQSNKITFISTEKTNQMDMSNKTKVAMIQGNSDAKQMTEVFDTMGMSHDEDMQRLEPKSGETGLYIRYNYSFIARLKQTPRTSQQKLSELKNYVLSFEGVTVRKSRGYERFMYQGKPILKIWIHGQITDIYFNLEPKAYQDSKYELEDMSENKMHERRPACLKLSGTSFLKYAKELVDIYMKEGQQKKEVAQMDDRLFYVSKEKLS